MFWIINTVLALAIIVLFPFVANALARRNLFFTTLESGDIKFVMRGETLRRIIFDIPKEDIPKYKKDGEQESGILIPRGLNYFEASGYLGLGSLLKDFFRKRFGLYWIGLPPFTSIHKFEITKERENPEGKKVDDWIEREEPEEVSVLRFTFPRPFLFKDMELGDRIPIHVLVVAKLEVVDPYLCIFLLKGKFFRNLSALVQGKVGDILKGVDDLNAFVLKSKAEDSDLLKDMKFPDDKGHDFNKEILEKQVGVRLVGISISKYDPADDGTTKEIRKAMNAKTLAKEKGEATIVEAQVYQDQLKIRTDADVARIRELAKARKEQVTATVEALASSNGSGDIVAQGAASILEMEAATGENSRLTTLVKGGGASVVVPTNPNKGG